MDINKLDQQLKYIAKSYLNLEKELLNKIIELDQKKGFYQLGYNSLFTYLTQALNLSPAVSYNFINVARKSIDVPELKEQVVTGQLSISKAQKMTSVLTKENHKEWFQLAQEKTHRELEREVAIASPKQAVKTQVKYIHPEESKIEKVKIKQKTPRIELKMGISEKIMLQLRRAQDLESQRLRKNIDLEETLSEVLEVYLERKDPVKKAQRQKNRGKLIDTSESKTKKAQELKTSQGGFEVKVQNGIAVDVEKRINGKIKISGKTRAKNNRAKLCNVDKNSSREERTPIPAVIKHQVQLRDNGQCTHKDKLGKRCASRRFLEVHHIKPVAGGGKNNLENLVLLCSGHHKAIHSSG